MNLIRKQTPFFPSLIDDFIGSDWNLKVPSFSYTMPAVNIKELDSQFEIELAVPGKKKDDFEIEVENGILSISSSQEEEQQVNEKGKFTRREFSYTSFRRSFTLPDSVDPTKIDARYADGVLQVLLPKHKEAQPQPKKLIKIR
ncbi:MAG: Hsp20/alpha crystallin family protein [Bacteroidetes bacterium]|nr:Hsp20/alpha crystallin family protein [Bacteroidota bacterium]MDA0984902.1 Hsp20/alpha crystallin family protein [Bacteroidota bacterium]